MDKRVPITLAVIAIIAVSAGVYYTTQQQEEKNDKLVVVASFYPLAYMAEQIGGDKVEITALIEPGVEVHSWQPSAGDIINCSDADVIIYNGVGLDTWLQDEIIPSIDTTGKVIVDTTQTVTLFESTEEEEIEEHGVYDPHTWLSPYEAKQQAEAIYDALVEADPDNTDYYTTRWETLSDKLTALDESYTTQLQGKTKTTIFVTHDAFGYIARRYGFEQEGIIGISADEQPSTQTLTDIIDLMQQTDTYTFYIEPGYSDIYVQTVKTELETRTGKTVQILTLYHLNGPQGDLDYIEQMENNLESLRLGLGS
ncbi:TPA: zinc ABC transporter solute-binding protein [Candidatus Bathyarchaeota archaeon]|nr:zinc ABC transporter solute-binding protein [Candidatus Bathyarchaeota archaeon]